MSDSAYVSTLDVSRALGVGVSTVKRWVDEGILPAHKTPGGHRKLFLADVLRLVRDSHFPRQNLGSLHPALGPKADFDCKDIVRALFLAFRNGNAEAVHDTIEGIHQAGMPAAKLADDVIAPAMRRIGTEWAAGRLDVMHEHRATQICSEALYRIKSLLAAQAERDRPRALGGVPEGQLHSLASQLIELVLLQEGWLPINLGANTPFAAFEKAMRELRPRLFWLSVTHVAEPKTFLAGYRRLYAAATNANVAVVVGGQGLTQELRSAMPYTVFGEDLTHFASFAAALHPRPRRRSRGRPRR